MKYFCLFVLCCVGCENPEGKSVSNSSYSIYVNEVEGHKYVIFDGYYCGGIIHAESCPCKVKAYKINNDGTTTEIK